MPDIPLVVNLVIGHRNILRITNESYFFKYTLFLICAALHQTVDFNVLTAPTKIQQPSYQPTSLLYFPSMCPFGLTVSFAINWKLCKCFIQVYRRDGTKYNTLTAYMKWESAVSSTRSQRSYLHQVSNLTD